MSTTDEDLTSLFYVCQRLDSFIAATVHAALCVLQALAASRRDVAIGIVITAITTIIIIIITIAFQLMMS